MWMMKMKHIFSMFLFVVFVVFMGMHVQAEDNMDEIIVHYTVYSSAQERYFNIFKIDMDVKAHSYGNWEFWYSNDGVNYKKDYESPILNSVGSYSLDHKLYDISGIAPDKPTVVEISYNTGSTYYCKVNAKANSTLLYYKYYATWEDEKKELFTTIPKEGYATEDIKDHVKGFYYVINSNNKSDFSIRESEVQFTSSINLPFDVSDFGKYIHVRAVSCSGKVSDVLTIPLDSNYIPRKIVKLSAMDGISKLTGAGSYLPGETVTISAELEEYYQFKKWSGTYENNKQTYTFQMPNKHVILTGSAERAAYTLIYDGMGGTRVPEPQMIQAGDSGKISSKEPIRNNYTFVEWNESGDGSGTGYQPGDTLVLTDNKTLIAIWKSDTYTIRLHANAPLSASNKITHFNYNEKKIELKDASTSIREANGITYFGKTSSYTERGVRFSDIIYFYNDSGGITNALYTCWSAASDDDYRWGCKNPDGSTQNGHLLYTDPNSHKYKGMILYDTTTKHYYRLEHLHLEGGYYALCLSNWGSDLTGWKDLGTSYPVTCDSGWTWYGTNNSTGEGYFEKSFTKSSEETLPSSSEVFQLTGWHTVDSDSTTDKKGTSWVNSNDIHGKYYASGTKVADLALTDSGSKTIELYAPWYNNTYRVCFYANGGRGSMIPVTYKYDDTEKKELPVNTFEKSQATFEYWRMYNPSSSSKVNDKAVVSNWSSEHNSSVNLYASWKAGEITYQIAYNGNGAEGYMPPVKNISYNQQVTISQSAYYKNGYQFAGWTEEPVTYKEYLKNKEQYSIIKAGQKVSKLTNIQGKTITYYALWKPDGIDENGELIHYTVRFDGNGSENGTINDIQADYDKIVKLPKNQFSKSNYHFTGWNTKADGNGTSYSELQEVKNLANTKDAVVILYAQWKINQYVVRFDGNKADSGNMTDIQIEYGQSRELPENQYQKAGYHFIGWNTEADGSGVSYKNKQQVKNLISGNGSIQIFYAQWVPMKCTIHFDGNGADIGSMDNLTISYETAKTLPKNQYQKTGYEFNGWNTKVDGSGVFYSDGDMYQNIDTEDNAKVILYAQWKGVSYSVKFDGNTANSGSMENQFMIYGEKMSLTGNKYGKTGYQFVGWNTKADGKGKSYQDGEEVMNLTSIKGEVIILYAQWKDVIPPVIKDIDGNHFTQDELIYEWTNQDVILQFTAEDNGSGMKTLRLESEDGKTKVINTEKIKKTITKEGISGYNLIAEDNTGNISVLHIIVKIDKQPPTADNENRYVFEGSESLTKTIKAVDEGGSGIKNFELYSGNAENEENPSLTLLKVADSISGDNAELTYTFEDDIVSDKIYYTLLIADNAGNVTKRLFYIDAAMSLQTKAWKYNKTTVTDDTETLTYMQYGDMRCWFETVLNGYMTEVTYDFCDELNELGLEDVTHTLIPAEAVTDSLVVYLPKTMVFEKTYTVTVRGKRGEREVSVTLNLMHTEMKHKPHPAIRYQNDMAMPWGGGEWIDYKKLAEEQKKKAQEQKKQIDN